MKTKFKVSGKDIIAEVRKTEEGKYKVEFEGKGFIFTLSKNQGVFSAVSSSGASYMFTPVFTTDEYIDFLFNDKIIRVKIGQRGDVSSAGRRERTFVLNSAISGLIKEIFIKVGDTVDVGDPVVAIEAMKMRNNIKSPVSGKIVELYINEGETIGTGSKILKIEVEPE